MSNSTYSLDIVTTTICRDDAEIKAVLQALKIALWKYQWHYQQASERQNRDVKSAFERSAEIVIEHLRAHGQDVDADNLESAVDMCIDKDILIKSKVFTQVKRIMKEEALKCNTIGARRWNNDLAEMMAQAFLDHCEKYPLDNAPSELDTYFEPWCAYEDMSR